MIYRFGPFELDEQGELVAPGAPVAIQPKPLALLAPLLRERDRVVPQDELFEALWPGDGGDPGSLHARGLRRAPRDRRHPPGPRSSAVSRVAATASARTRCAVEADAGRRPRRTAAPEPVRRPRRALGHPARGVRAAWPRPAKRRSRSSRVLRASARPGSSRSSAADDGAARARSCSRAARATARACRPSGSGPRCCASCSAHADGPRPCARSPRHERAGGAGSRARCSHALWAPSRPAHARAEPLPALRRASRARSTAASGAGRSLDLASRTCSGPAPASLRLLEHLAYETCARAAAAGRDARDERGSAARPGDARSDVLRSAGALRGGRAAAASRAPQVAHCSQARARPPGAGRADLRALRPHRGRAALLREALRLLAERGESQRAGARSPAGGIAPRAGARPDPPPARRVSRRPAPASRPPRCWGASSPLAVARRWRALPRAGGARPARRGGSAGVIEEARGGAGLRFTHALFQEAV